MAFASAPRMSVLGMFTSCLDPLNARITLLLSFVGAHYLRRDRATADDHASAFGRCDQQADSRRDPRCRQGFGLPAARPDQRGGAEPPARRLQPSWAVPTKAPGDVALGRAPAVRVLGACRVDRGHRTLSDLPLDHAAGGHRQRLLARVLGFRRATGTARPRMDEGKRWAKTEHAAPDPGARPAALARLRGSVDWRLAEQRLEQRPQRRHDAFLPADDGTADGRGAKRWSKTMGSPRAVSAPVDAEDQAGGTGDRSLGGGNLAASTWGRIAHRHPRHRRVLAGNLVRACG